MSFSAGKKPGARNRAGDQNDNEPRKRKEPKKARVVEIPEDRRLDEKTYNELFSHAKNSGIYYCTASPKSEQQIREKLIAKGYVEEEVTVFSKKEDGSVANEYKANIIEDTIRHLEMLVLLDDSFLARGVVESMLRKGKGAQEIKRKLREKKIDSDIMDESIESLEEDEDAIFEAIEKAVFTYKRKSVYRREQDPYKQQQKLFSFLMGRGFNTSQIKVYLDERAQEELEESE